MRLSDVTRIAQALEENQVRYVIVGGLAVVAHGYGRMTFDVDLVVGFDPSNVVRTFRALAALGYQPRVPITAEQFAKRATRERWIREKGMDVLNFWSDSQRDTPIDLFVDEPFDFEAVYGRAVCDTLEDGTPFRFVDIDTLMEMKRAAGRAKDADDLEHLEMLANDR